MTSIAELKKEIEKSKNEETNLYKTHSEFEHIWSDNWGLKDTEAITRMMLQAQLLGMQEGKRQAIEEELEFLDKVRWNNQNDKTDMELLDERISKLKEMLKEETKS